MCLSESQDSAEIEAPSAAFVWSSALFPVPVGKQEVLVLRELALPDRHSPPVLWGVDPVS